MSKSQLLRTIKKLEDDGILIVVRAGEKNSYGINLQHEYFKELDGFIKSNACMIKVGKKPKTENGSLSKSLKRVMIISIVKKS